MNTKLERYFSGLLFLATLFLLYVAWGYTAPIAYDPLGPRPYPLLVLGLMAACTLFLTIRPKAEEIDLGYTPSLLKKLAICLPLEPKPQLNVFIWTKNKMVSYYRI